MLRAPVGQNEQKYYAFATQLVRFRSHDGDGARAKARVAAGTSGEPTRQPQVSNSAAPSTNVGRFPVTCTRSVAVVKGLLALPMHGFAVSDIDKSRGAGGRLSKETFTISGTHQTRGRPTPRPPAWILMHRSSGYARTCRVECVQCRPGQDHSSEAGIIEANEQLIFTPFPGQRHPASGHPLRDLPADRGLPTRYPQRGADRALAAGPSRGTRPSRPLRSRSQPHHFAGTDTGGTYLKPGAPADTQRGHLGESPRAYPPFGAVYSPSPVISHGTPIKLICARQNACEQPIRLAGGGQMRGSHRVHRFERWVWAGGLRWRI
jgi:hypothetical protein